MKYALVTGDRHAQLGQWKHVIETAFADHDVQAVIHGDARGIDTIAADVADDAGMMVFPFPADWSKHGKAAGPIRNTQMLDFLRDCWETGHGAVVLAFHPDVAGSKGTKNMVNQSVAAGMSVIVYDGKSSVEVKGRV